MKPNINEGNKQNFCVKYKHKRTSFLNHLFCTIKAFISANINADTDTSVKGSNRSDTNCDIVFLFCLK